MTASPPAQPVLFRSFPGFQTRALQATADEVLAGGAKGGGKSLVLVAKPLYQIEKAAYKALVLRHSFPELKEILDRMHAMYPKLPAHMRPQWKGDQERWEFPSGAKIQIGFCHKREHIQRYQGQEWSDILFDEIGNLADEGVLEMLLAEQRSPDPTIRRQLFATANPGGVAHGWLKRRFIGPCGKRGERVVYVKRRLPNGDVMRVTRQFVPGTVLDNPIYANDPRYMARLMSLPDRLRRCLMDGDWDAATGAAFDELDPVHFVPEFTPPAHWPYIAAFDWGFSHWAVFMWGRVSEDGRVYVMDTHRWRFMQDWDLTAAITEMVPAPALRHVHAGHDLWDTSGGKGDSTPTRAQYFRAQGIGVVQANIKRVAGYANLMQYLGWRETDYVERRTPMLLFANTPGNRWLHDEHLPSLVVNPDNPVDVLKVDADSETGEGGDDGYDCFVAGTLVTTRRGEVPIEEVTASDQVMTRKGWRGVLASWCTGPDRDVYRVRTNDGRELVGTGNHPVWVADRGFVPLESLRYGDSLMTWQKASPSSSMASPSAAIPTAHTGRIGAITAHMRDTACVAWGFCIRKCGSPCTDRSRVDITFTTSTRTRTTTRRTILNVSRQKSIASDTKLSSGVSRLCQQVRRAWLDCNDWLRRLPVALRFEQAPAFAFAARGSDGSGYPSSAPSVAQHSWTDPCNRAGTSATPTAKCDGDTPLELTSRNAHARRADRPLSATNTSRPGAAPKNVPSDFVVSVEPAGQAKVYNLQTTDPEAAEYYANGTLVHNCLRYLLASRPFKAHSGLPIHLTSNSDFVLRREAEKVFRPDLTEIEGGRRPALPGEQPYMGS